MRLFEGLSAFPITPTDAHARVDEHAFQRVLEPLITAGVDSIGVLGSTGSYVYLNREQRRRAIEIAVAIANGRVPVIAGIGAMRTDTVMGMAEDAVAAGAEGLLLAPVSYIPLTDDEVRAHVQAIANAAERPICLYNNPTTTRFDFHAALVGQLSAHPNIAAIKTPAPAHDPATYHASLTAQVEASFSVGYSVDALACEALIAGGQAWYSAMAGVFPERCLALARAARAGNATQARRLDAALQPLWALCSRHSSYRVAHEAARLLGHTSRPPLRPIAPLPSRASDDLADVITRLKLR
ncbi:dihydrodipicolinate synthase family protein [Salinisphaera sp. T31B1]|uniref:dihydrodipicolinate synthase family protein n=1 Tax=Salinisphaera sp. T31B1 TaxID=727963 RepID=UPI00333F260E